MSAGPYRRGRKTDGCSDRDSSGAHGTEIAALAPPNKEYVIAMEMLIGPLIERNGGYSYDTFTLAEGLRSSFRYLRLDAARYDQRALIAEASRDPHCETRVCETQAEFERLIGEAGAGQTSSPTAPD